MFERSPGFYLPKKDVRFIIGDWNAKVGSQEIPGVTGKFGLGAQKEPRQRLTEFCQENALVIANTLFQQHKTRLSTWTSPDGQYQNQIDYILCSQRWRCSRQSAKTRLGADCCRPKALPRAENVFGLEQLQSRGSGLLFQTHQPHSWKHPIPLVSDHLSRDWMPSRTAVRFSWGLLTPFVPFPVPQGP